MKIVIANGPGRLADGRHLVLFPSRCDWVGDHKPFAYYPYELAYLSALLKREWSDEEVVMVDGNYWQLGPEAYLEKLLPLAPDVFITECAHLIYQPMTRIMQALKEGRNMASVLTGPYGTAFPDKAKADGWDDVIAGEYEHKVLALLRRDMEPTGYIDLNWLPWPEDTDIKRIWYTENQNPRAGMVQIYPTRGCPLRCTFCTSALYYGGHNGRGNSHRVRLPENVCQEIEYLAHKYGDQFQGCFFNEETHNANMPWLQSFAEALIIRGLHRYAYDAMCGYWNLDEATIKLLAAAGYKQLRMGVESFDKSVGRAIAKRAHFGKLVDVVRWCKKAGIRVYVTAMVGAPGSTMTSDLETFGILRRLRQDGLVNHIQHSTCTPNPGTELWRQAVDNGWLQEQDQSNYHWRNAVLVRPEYPPEQVNQMMTLFQTLRQ